MRVNPSRRSTSLTSPLSDKIHSSCKIKKQEPAFMPVLAFFLLGVLSFCPYRVHRALLVCPGGYSVLGASVLYFILRPVIVGSRRMAMIRGFFL